MTSVIYSPNPVSDDPLCNGLVGWWKCGPMPGSFGGVKWWNLMGGAPGSIGGTLSTSGFDFNTRRGGLGGCWRGNGSDGYVDLGSGVGNFGSQSFTVIQTFCPLATSSNMPMSSRAGGSSTGFEFLHSSSQLSSRVQSAGGTAFGSTLACAANAWHFAACIVDRSAGTVATFLDGTLSSTASVPAGAITNSQNLMIGRRGSLYGSFLVDDTMLFQRALPQSSLEAIWQDCLTQNPRMLRQARVSVPIFVTHPSLPKADINPLSRLGLGATARLARSATSKGKYALDASAGDLTLAGSDAALTADRVLAADPGALQVQAPATDLLADRIMVADGGSIPLVGNDVEFLHGFSMDAEPGQLSLAGSDADLLAERTMGADAGALVLRGVDTPLLQSYTLLAEAGSLRLVGANATGKIGKGIDAQAGSLRLQSVGVSLERSSILTAQRGQLTLHGNNATLTRGSVGAVKLSPFRSRLFHSRIFKSKTVLS